MQQQLFEFVLQATKASPVRLEPDIAAEVTRLMSAAIVAVALHRAEEIDEESRGQRQAHG